MSDNGEVLFEARGRVGIVTLHRPERLNAITWTMIDQIADQLARIQDDPEIRAVVVTGSGRAFSAGTDLQDLASGARSARSADTMVRPSIEGEPAPWAFANLRKPTVAAINGAAVGVAAEITLMCDVRVASENARIGWVFPHRGLVPDTGIGTWILPRIVGLGRAAQILYSGDILDATTCKGLGLVDEIVAPDQLIDRAVAWAERLSTGSPLAIGEIKRLLYQGLVRDPQDHITDNGATMQRMFASADFKEGVQAFMEKRDPHWTGH